MTWLRKILRIEPGVSLAWFLVERAWSIFSNWTVISGLLSGALMIYLSAITNWIASRGPAAVGGIGIATALAVSLSISRIRLWAARRATEKATERFIEARVSKSNVNPLDVTFTNQRIDLRDLTRPLTTMIKGKSFVRCQIVGPVNVILWGTTNLANPTGVGCEAVYCDNDVHSTNAIFLADCDFRDCEFFNTTFLVFNFQFDHFIRQIGLNWITSNPMNYTYFREGVMEVKAPPSDEPELPLAPPDGTAQIAISSEPPLRGGKRT